MKNIKNAKGFTLIELLAVIVVLAIVILMASMAVIPRMNEARRQVFAMEANEAINAASSYFMNGEMTGGASFPVTPGTTKCVEIKTLISSGDFKAKGYSGKIEVEKVGNSYVYSVTMTNDKLIVKNKGYKQEEGKAKESVDIKADDVVDYKSDDSSALSCPTASTGN